MGREAAEEVKRPRAGEVTRAAPHHAHQHPAEVELTPEDPEDLWHADLPEDLADDLCRLGWQAPRAPRQELNRRVRIVERPVGGLAQEWLDGQAGRRHVRQGPPLAQDREGTFLFTEGVFDGVGAAPLRQPLDRGEDPVGPLAVAGGRSVAGVDGSDDVEQGDLRRVSEGRG